MKPGIQKAVNWGLLILSVVLIVVLVFQAFPNKEDKDKALAECKKNEVLPKDCKMPETKLGTLFVAFGVFLLFIYLVKTLYAFQENLLVDKEVATRYYLQWLEVKRKISFPRGKDGEFLFKETESEDTQEWYRMILAYYDKDKGQNWYAPIELGRFYEIIDGEKQIRIGRGRGKLTTNTDEANIFKFKALPKPTEPPLNIEMIGQLFEEMYKRKNGITEPEKEGK